MRMTLRWAQCMLSGSGWQEAWRWGGLMLGETIFPVYFVVYLGISRIDARAHQFIFSDHYKYEITGHTYLKLPKYQG